MQRLQIDSGLRRFRRFAKDLGRPLRQLSLPVGNLVWVNFEFLSQLRQGFITRYCRHGDFGFESRGVFSSRFE
jgi:hypothetical protein